jgi:hypothetical protein
MRKRRKRIEVFIDCLTHSRRAPQGEQAKMDQVAGMQRAMGVHEIRDPKTETEKNRPQPAARRTRSARLAEAECELCCVLLR